MFRTENKIYGNFEPDKASLSFFDKKKIYAQIRKKEQKIRRADEQQSSYDSSGERCNQKEDLSV